MLFLRSRCPWIPLERTAVGDIFRKRMREAGLPDCAKHVYGLRHTFAMRLLARGVGMKAIRRRSRASRSFYGTSAYLRLDVYRPCCAALLSPVIQVLHRSGVMRKTPALPQRFDAAASAYISSSTRPRSAKNGSPMSMYYTACGPILAHTQGIPT